MHIFFKKANIKQVISLISPHTIKYLNLLLPILLIEFIWFAVSFYTNIRLDPVAAITIYSPIFEHLMMSLLLTMGSAAIFDIAQFEQKRK